MSVLRVCYFAIAVYPLTIYDTRLRLCYDYLIVVNNAHHVIKSCVSCKLRVHN